MTAAKKSPTASDLSKKLDASLAEMKAMRTDVNALMQWKLQEDAYRAALKRVRDEERESTQEQTSVAWLKVIKQLYPILAILAAILYAYAQTRGIK